jgi:hypothetical protein
VWPTRGPDQYACLALAFIIFFIGRWAAKGFRALAGVLCGLREVQISIYCVELRF